MKIDKLLKAIAVFIITCGILFLVTFKCQNINKSHNMNNLPSIGFSNLVDAVKNRHGYYINAAVLYVNNGENYTAEAALDYLKQSVSIGLNVFSIDVSKKIPDLKKYDILYLDESLIKYSDYEELSNVIVSYVRGGGNIFVANNLFEIFPRELLGVKKFVKLKEAPFKINISEKNNDLNQIQYLVADFLNLYREFSHKDFLREKDYGMAVVPGSAISLIECNDVSIYTINNFGKGTVFYTNPLLPNKFSKSAFSLKESKEKQAPFSNTTATFNQLIYGYFASYIAKQIYGFSLNRVFGSYASPVMGWSLHYENIPGIRNNTLKSFGELTEKYNQIPSFSLVRNAITWITRTETASYLLNASDNKKDLLFKANLYENPFGAGTYIVSDNKWLQLKTRENAKSGVEGDINRKVLLYPFFVDYDKDGLVDMFSGSSDGKIYYFKNLGFSGKDHRLVMDKPKILDISLSGYSAPILFDINGDGVLDIISGEKDGNIYYFKGKGNLQFEDKKLIIKTDIQGMSLPSAGDLNSDGVVDLVVGSDTGVVLLYYGTKNGDIIEFSHKKMSAISRLCADCDLGKYLSPYITDYNKDGIQDIILGTYDGYVALFKGDKSQKYIFDGFLLSDEMNVKGNYNLKFGLFCNPRLIDINKDGKLDIIAGYEDVDLPYPIDSPYFPYKKELSEQMTFAKNKKYYVGMHYFSGWYASARKEKYEVKAHFKALKKYGIDYKMGVNQHGGPVTRLSEADSYRRLYDEGILWESFFESKEHAFANWIAAETAVVNPFFITDNGKRKILVQNIQSAVPCSGRRLPCSKDRINITAKYGSPVLNYHHADDSDIQMAKDLVNDMESYRRKFEYNFVKENQMMYAIAAAYNLKVNVKEENGKIKFYPDEESNKFPLYDKNVQSAAGFKIEFSDKMRDKLSTDAAVWIRKDNSLFIGLDRTVSLYPDCAKEAPHLLRVNLPAKIKYGKDNNDVSLNFLDDGMMQAVVEGKAYTDSENWETEYNGKTTIFTKFGDKDSLHILFGEQNI